MTFSSLFPPIARAGHWLAVPMLFPATLALAADPDVAIFVRAYNGYTRTQLADHSLQPESYTFAEGGRFDGSMADKSIDSLSFYRIARTIAEPLKDRGYIPSFDSKNTDLVILVFWGTTTGAERGQFGQGEPFLQDAIREYAVAQAGVRDFKADPSNGMHGQDPQFGTTEANAKSHAESSMEQAMMMQTLANAQRDQNNATNARILGYQNELQRAWDIPWFSQSRDVISEIELGRYFVVLKAYDYRTFASKRQRKIMWEARFSIPAQGYAFDEQLAAMTKCASRYFGEDAKHLVRTRYREGKIEIGIPRVIEMDKK